MCDFFSLVTSPEKYPGQKFYFDWEARKEDICNEGWDSHDHIQEKYKLSSYDCNEYEYNPWTREFRFRIHQHNLDDTVSVHNWLDNLNWSKIIEPIIIKPVICPFTLDPVIEVTSEQVEWMHQWIDIYEGCSRNPNVADVSDIVLRAICDNVGENPKDTIKKSVRETGDECCFNAFQSTIRESIWGTQQDWAYEMMWAYISSFFKLDYGIDLSPAIRLWESGLVVTANKFDYETKKYQLHTGKDFNIVYEEIKNV